MSAPEFKVGDRVRIVSSSYTAVPAGMEGVVTRTTRDGVLKVRVAAARVPVDTGGIGWTFFAHQLAPIDALADPAPVAALIAEAERHEEAAKALRDLAEQTRKVLA